MSNNILNISDLVTYQLPDFVSEEFDCFVNFYEEYYKSLELTGGPLDISHNFLDEKDVDNLKKHNLVQEFTLAEDLDEAETDITLNSVYGLQSTNGVIKINDEIIFYESIDNQTNTLLGCKRGYSATTELNTTNTTFEDSVAAEHSSGSKVNNITNLFKFLVLKNYQDQYLSGFPYESVIADIGEDTLIKNIKDFYSYKGTSLSVEFLFRALYAEEVTLRYPKDYVIKTSYSDWTVDDVIKVEQISGDPYNLVGYELFQTDASGEITDVLLIDQILVNNISNYASGNKNIYEIRLNVLEKTNFIIPADTLLRRDLTSTDTVVTVDSTISFPEENGIIQIDDEYITYRFKSFNQFFDCVRGAYDTVAVNHTSSNKRVTTTEFLYGTSPTNNEVVKLRLLGVLSNTTINDGAQYYKEGDIINLSQDGASDSRPQFTTWIKNESGNVASSSNSQINNVISQFTGDVTSVFKTDDYSYIASTGLPTHPIGPFLGVGTDIRNQFILKSIPLKPQINTKTQLTDDTPIGIFVNGVEAMSRQDDETVSFGPIDSVQILQSGFGFEADTQPIFRISDSSGSNATFEANIVDGKVISIDVTSGGSGYTRDENLEVAYGFNAEASVANTTDIANGQIRNITVTNGGSDYVLPPNVEIFDITGRGQNAFGIARVQNGQVVGIDVLNGGRDFFDISNIRVNIISKGSGVVARAISKKWKFDRVFKINNILDVDTGNYISSTTSRSDAGNGYLFQSRNAAFALQYGYAFNPKLLRFSLNDNVTGPNANYAEKSSNYTHSPILGWAYDGHPIYGPYSYVDPLDNTSSITRMTSSYVLASSGSADRPSTTTYPLGSFIQDYTFSLGQGSLDRSNGRFCVTPEFPNGTYAYFITVDNFSNPVYPYILGETYNSVPAQNNLLISHIQSESILPANARRLRSSNTPSKGFDANLLVDFTDRGIIDSFEVYGGSSNFKTTDYLFINNDDTEGSRSYAKVSKLVGVTVSGVSYRVDPTSIPSGLTLDAYGRPTLPFPLTITGREFTMLNPTQQNPVKYLVTMTTTEPHGLSLGDEVDIRLDRPNFTGAMTIRTRVSDYQTITYAPPSISTELEADVSFNSSAINVTVADDFRVNDYIKINDEILKITSIDTNLDQLQVERSQFNTKLRLHATGNTVSLHIPENDPDYRIAVGDAFTATGISATIYNINKANKTIELRVASGNVTTSTVAVDQSTPDTRNIVIQSVTPKQSFWEFDVTNTGNYFRRNLTSADFSFDFVKGTEYTFDLSDGTLNGRVLNFSTDSEKINKLQDVVYTGTPGTAGAQLVITREALLRPNVSRVFYYDSDNTVVYSGAYLNVLRLPDSTQIIRSISNDSQFSFISPRQPEFPEYIDVISYNTNSKSAIGTIADIELIDGGEGYKKLPKVDGVVHTDLDNAKFSFNIVSGIVQDDVSVLLGGRRYDPNTTALKVVSQTGTGAVLVPSVTNGEIVNVVVSDGGEGYVEDDYIVAYDTSANIFPTSSSIGKIRNIRFTNYGSQFNPDKTFSKNLIFEKKVIVTELSGNLFKKNENVQQNNGFSGVIKDFQEIGNKSYLLTVEERVGSIAPTSTTVSTLNGTIQGTTARVVSVTDPEIIANVGALIEKVGYFDSDLGKLSSSSQKITDSYYYQDFSYVIRSTRSLSEYRDKLYDSTHPLGFKLFGEVSVENDIDFDDTVSGLPFSVGLPDDHSDNTVIITLDPVNVESDIVFKKYELSTINSAVVHKYPGQGAALLNFLENQIDAVQIADLSATFSGGRNTYTLTTTDGNFPTATKNTSVVLALNEIFQEPFEIIDIDGISYDASIATITTSSDHGYVTTSGSQTYPNNVYVHIDNVTSSSNLNFNDKFEIYDVPASNSIRVLFNNPNEDLGSIDAIDLTNATMVKGQFKYDNNNITLFEAPKKGTTFNSIFYKFVSESDDARYSYKVKNILFDGTSTSYPLYYLSGANLVTETDENLLVFIDGVLQIYGESYTIDRSVNPNTINFTEAHASDRHFFAYSFSKYKILNNISSRFDDKERVFDFRYLTENVQPPDVHQVLILLDGVPQVEGTTYTVNENIVTFNEAPQKGKKCHMLYFYGKTFDKTISVWNGEFFQTIDDINERTPDGCRYFNKRNKTFEYIKKGDYINIDGESSKEIISVDQKVLENTDNLVYTVFVYTDSEYIRGKNAVAQATVSGTTIPGGNTVTASGTVSVSGTFGVPPIFNYEVSGVVVNDPGLEYDVAPIVLFQTKCNNPGKGAEAYATVVNGKIQSVTVTNPGSGYTEAPDVIFAKKYEIIKPQTPLFIRKETIVNLPLNEDDTALISPGFTVDSTQIEEEFTIPLVYTDISLTKNIFLQTEHQTNKDPARPALAYTLQTFDQNKFKYEPLEINDPLTAYLGTNVNIENVSRYAPSLILGDFTTHAGRSVAPSDPAVINYGEESYMAFGFTLPNGAGINDDVIQIDGNLTNVPSSGFIELGNELIDASRISGPTTPGVQAAVDVTAVGYIESVNVSNTGSGYETAPTVTVTSPGGTDATITATLTSSGTFKRFDITNGGSGYTYPPDVTLGGGMTGVGATAEITGGVVTGIVLDGTTYDTTNNDDIFSFGAGTSIAQNGTGVGEQGGFNVGGAHLRFGDSNGGIREVVLEPVNTTGIDTIRIYAIRGNDTNGGELPDGDSGDESLRIAYQVVNVGNPINNNWVDAGVIIWDSSDDGTYGTPSAGLDNFDLTLPAGASGTRVFFKLYQLSSSGTIYDNYGILSVSFLDINTVYTDSTVTLTNNPLDNGGLGATADVYLNKEIANLTVSDGGTGYDPATIYNLTFTGGNPTSTAVGTANAKFEFDITVTNPGDGYNTATVTFIGGGGSNLAADLTVDPSTTQVTNATISNQGTGYTSIPTFQVSNPDDVWNFKHIRARERGANGTTAFPHPAGKYARLAWRG